MKPAQSEQELDAFARFTRERYGYWLADGPIAAALFVYVEAGYDPTDKAPLTMVRRALPDEVVLWQTGKHHALANLLLTRGAPVRMPAQSPEQMSLFARARRWVREKFGRKGA